MTAALQTLVRWYGHNARDLPWRAASKSPWQVLVSEVMLQQTPVNRVLPVYEEWVTRWPTPGDLAVEPAAEAIRAWGRLGYPRRALRLHSAAVICTERYGGFVPSDLDDLRSLPGVGEYTAAAVAAFAFGQRQAVLDTNVRRVYARLFDGQEFERAGATTATERQRALALLPVEGRAAADTSVAVMEFGALVCTARAPRCDGCPIQTHCRWNTAGHPTWEGPPRLGQSYKGTDRQCRGRVLAALREASDPLARTEFDNVWHDEAQLNRALVGLIADGLVVNVGSSRDHNAELYSLPE